MMDLHGRQLIGNATSADGVRTFVGRNPASGEATTPPVHEATPAEVDRALRLAEEAFQAYRQLGPETIAGFLETVTEEWLALGDALLETAHAETALPAARLTGERARMVAQTSLFASIVREGSWTDARIDRGDPDRKPLPRPDVRRMLQAIGPTAVFGASNFPLAISVAGGDTVSALAVGCPVVAKAHPAHPGTSELLGRAIVAAAARTGMPDGVFSMLHGAGPEVGLALVRHPLTRVVAFTGSLAGGRALFDAAAARPDPIPVYAEMGSVNPVFVLPGAMAERAASIAAGYVQSVTLGAGQFCTNPGILFAVAGGPLDTFLAEVERLAGETPPATMLHEGIARSFRGGVERLRATPGVRALGAGAEAHATGCRAACSLFSVDAATLEAAPHLWDEVFGPASVVVRCTSAGDFVRIADRLTGHLTASIHGTLEELAAHEPLVRVLERRVGRIVWNGFPTGIEVCNAMHHGGPYPATTDPHFTSIGGASIERFVRPVCFQGFPQAALPPELKNSNERGIWRMVDGVRTKDDC